MVCSANQLIFGLLALNNFRLYTRKQCGSVVSVRDLNADDPDDAMLCKQLTLFTSFKILYKPVYGNLKVMLVNRTVLREHGHVASHTLLLFLSKSETAIHGCNNFHDY